MVEERHHLPRTGRRRAGLAGRPELRPGVWTGPTATSGIRQTRGPASVTMPGMDEATALLTTLGDTPAGAPTACAGWTAHDLVAHLAAGAAEMADHAERALSGAPERETAGMAQREAPFAAMDDPALREILFGHALRLEAATAELARLGLDLPFSGRRLSASEIRLHGRSEAAIHRWDLCGDDGVGDELLSQPELTAHAVTVLNSMLDGSGEATAIRARSAALEAPRELRLAAPGQPDVVVVVEPAGGRLALAPPDGSPTVITDPATRLLALWGRRSPGRSMVWSDDEAAGAGLARFLWGPAARIGPAA